MTFTAVAENNGCVNSDDVTVIVDCTSLFIPNSFSPNRDGINDVFLVDGTGIYEFELKIFDRWGELLFFTTDPGDAWTGGFKDYYVPDGVYTYQVKALDFKGNPIIGNGLVLGSILVIR
jgi:gliding motility-associated-like protein